MSFILCVNGSNIQWRNRNNYHVLIFHESRLFFNSGCFWVYRDVFFKVLHGQELLVHQTVLQVPGNIICQIQQAGHFLEIISYFMYINDSKWSRSKIFELPLFKIYLELRWTCTCIIYTVKLENLCFLTRSWLPVRILPDCIHRQHSGIECPLQNKLYFFKLVLCLLQCLLYQ